MTHPNLTQLLYQACQMEATARKPGNVHPQANFQDMTYNDFLLSADIAAPILARAEQQGVGATILQAVRETRQTIGRNTNLGMLLLLAPLAAVPASQTLAAGIAEVTRNLTIEDARNVYEAIRLANPGGMGSVPEADVSTAPQITLRAAMELARSRDSIAEEYASDFALVTGQAARILAGGTLQDWELRVIHLHLWFLARTGDTLIARKCGEETSEEAQMWARHIFAEGWPETDGSIRLCQKFDRWLRADGHRRNPGTTADLVAATLFVVLRDNLTTFPDWAGPPPETAASKSHGPN